MIFKVVAFRDEANEVFAWLEQADELNDPGLTELVVHPFLTKLGVAPEQLDVTAFNAAVPEQ